MVYGWFMSQQHETETKHTSAANGFALLRSLGMEGRAAIGMTEFAKLFGKDRGWAYRALKAGVFKVMEVNNRIVIPIAEVLRLANGNDVAQRKSLQAKSVGNQRTGGSSNAIATNPPERQDGVIHPPCL